MKNSSEHFYRTQHHQAAAPVTKIESHIRIVHFTVRCAADGGSDGGSQCICKSAKFQSRVQLHQHLFAMSTNLFLWISIFLLSFFNTAAAVAENCAFSTLQIVLYIFMSNSFCLCVLFSVHFKFFVVYSFTSNRIKCKQ